MAPANTIWHKESLKLKEIFGTREGFEMCPHQLSPSSIKASVAISSSSDTLLLSLSVLTANKATSGPLSS